MRQTPSGALRIMITHKVDVAMLMMLYHMNNQVAVARSMIRHPLHRVPISRRRLRAALGAGATYTGIDRAASTKTTRRQPCGERGAKQ